MESLGGRPSCLCVDHRMLSAGVFRTEASSRAVALLDIDLPVFARRMPVSLRYMWLSRCRSSGHFRPTQLDRVRCHACQLARGLMRPEAKRRKDSLKRAADRLLSRTARTGEHACTVEVGQTRARRKIRRTPTAGAFSFHARQSEDKALFGLLSVNRSQRKNASVRHG
jgi:hypothetical protein